MAVSKYQSPLGPIQITAESKGITRVQLQFGKKFRPNEEEELPVFSRDQLYTSSEKACGHLRDCVEWFDVYFEGKFDVLRKMKFPQISIKNEGQ